MLLNVVFVQGKPISKTLHIMVKNLVRRWNAVVFHNSHLKFCNCHRSSNIDEMGFVFQSADNQLDAKRWPGMRS